MNQRLTQQLLTMISFLLITGVSSAQYTLIPDSAFEATLIDLGHDTEGTHDGQILTADAQSVTTLKPSNAGITDYTGIEAFTSLQTFWPGYNDITTIDLSALTQLTDLRVTATLLDSIDVSHNTLLQTLYVIAGNNITEIDLSNNPNIMFLLLGTNNISSVDLSGLPELRWFKIQYNPISELDLSNNPLLTVLDISYTSIADLDYSDIPGLYDLTANECGISEIDLSANSAMRYLELNYNQIQSIDVSHMSLLTDFFIRNNELQSLDLSNNVDLFRFNGSSNQLTSLNVQSGFNEDIDFMIATSNPDLSCVQVDDPVYAQDNWSGYVDAGVAFSTDCSSTGPDCSAFGTAPVELTKSFDPVDGVQDRVQVKWFKGTGQERYTVEDNAACDIEYWAYRYKDEPEDDWINIPPAERDTSLLPYTTVKKNNNKELFKWPLKFRLNNGTNQVQPNHGYRWRVRCYCDQGALVDGAQVITPWSEVKYFNTPDFDPSTGIYTPPLELVSSFDSKSLTGENDVSFEVYPNPSDGRSLSLKFSDELQSGAQLTLTDITGKIILSVNLSNSKDRTLNLEMTDRLTPGLYLLTVTVNTAIHTERVLVR